MVTLVENRKAAKVTFFQKQAVCIVFTLSSSISTEAIRRTRGADIIDMTV